MPEEKPNTARAVTVSEVVARLVKMNHKTAERFRQIAEVLPAGMSAEDFNLFSSACLSIADTGWKSYESVDLLLSISAHTGNQVGLTTARLVAVAQYGTTLCGYSHEPAMSYFRFIESTLDLAIPDSPLLIVETVGGRLHSKYQHASALVANYFQAAQHLLVAGQQTQPTRGASTPGADLIDWAQVIDGQIDHRREDLNKLLKLSLNLGYIPWRYVGEIQRQSNTASLTYLIHFEQLQARLPRQATTRVDALLLSRAGPDIEQLITSVLLLSALEIDELLVMLQAADSIEETPILVSLFEQADRLPLDRPDVIERWLSVGLDFAGDNSKALNAYVRLESSLSQQTLSQCRGQVSYRDHKGTLDLLAEAMVAHHVTVEPMEADSQFRQDAGVFLPHCDGKTVRLPAVVNLFEQAEENFGFYKVSLFHQLGYAEFGCFESIANVNQSINALQDSTLAERLFLIVEDARIDWLLIHKYPGLSGQMERQKLQAVATRREPAPTLRAQVIEALVLTSLDVGYESKVDEQYWAQAAVLGQFLAGLREPQATVDDCLRVVQQCHDLIVLEETERRRTSTMSASDSAALLEELPEPVAYRGEIDVAQVESTLKIEALVTQLEEQLESLPEQQPNMLAPGMDQDQIELGDLKAGDVGQGVAMLLSELENQLQGGEGSTKPEPGQELAEFLGGISSRTSDATRHVYDEWDYQIGDYRVRWCTLFEHRDLEKDEDYVPRILSEHQDLSRRIRQQLNRVRPEMLRKVRGVTEGEELDLERTIAYVVDRKAGFTPDDNIYVQRQRKERDVSTLFLLDMSASTDDIVPDPDAAPIEVPDVDDDEYLVEFFARQKALEDASRRIIDLEKESVSLMADALEGLGDAYAVCGFSGYGRESVDYYVCKDFNEKFDSEVKARIGGIKPCRSTRMGPPIRHATQSLLKTGSRIKAMIIISDGYPQDHDYGMDRNSREYGLMDTMKALSEAKQQGVLTYCLTVDPSGHDYLRAMCPDNQYMVIQDLKQLPEEVSRVYRSLTG
jgi:nitric oxide reductase NorD protein